MNQPASTLISEKSAALVENAAGTGKVVLVCEHAGQTIPAFIGSLGLDAGIMNSHIAWDIGAAELARGLSTSLNSPLILQRYTRLAYDCNRAFDAIDAIVVESDNIPIPANAELGLEQRCKRYDEIYVPFENAISNLLDERQERQQDTILVTVHSFTSVYKGQSRGVDLGILHDEDTRLADALLLQTSRVSGFLAARNEPYSPKDGVTHNLITHGIKRGLANVMLEIRNDLISDETGQQLWTERLTSLLKHAMDNNRF